MDKMKKLNTVEILHAIETEEITPQFSSIDDDMAFGTLQTTQFGTVEMVYNRRTTVTTFYQY